MNNSYPQDSMMNHPVWTDPVNLWPLGFGALPFVAQVANAPAPVTVSAFWIAALSALVVIVKSIADPISLRRQVKTMTEMNITLKSDRDADRRDSGRQHDECRQEVEGLKDEVKILHLALRRALNESPREYVARDEKTEED